MNLLLFFFLIRVELGITTNSSGQQNAKLFLFSLKFTVVVRLNRIQCPLLVTSRYEVGRPQDTHNFIHYLGSPCHLYPLVHFIN